jgi:thiol-disulfide isomerase/thioredoxin
MFKASWCHACAKVYPRFVELARQHEAAGCLRCYAVQFDENKKLCRSLGVNSLPYFQVYGGPQAGMCLEERGIGPKRLHELDELFARYRSGWQGTATVDEDNSESDSTASAFSPE